MWIWRTDGRPPHDLFLPPHDPFLEVISHAIGRLKSLSITASLKILPDITAQLSLPAPLLESLSLCGGYRTRTLYNPALATSLFNGDLSSLRVLHLQCVRTELPRRNMVNLTSFTLCYTLTHEISIGQLLDFLESAPRLRHVELHDAPFISGDQNGRLVSLARLENLIIRAAEPPSLLLDHILVPVGASLETELKSPRPRIEDQLPRSLDNLRNLSNFTRLYLSIDESDSLIKIAGLNGRVRLVSTSPGASIVDFVLESLSRFNTSTVEQLEIS